MLRADKWVKLQPKDQAVFKSKTEVSTLSVVTYNVWFETHYMEERMKVLNYMLAQSKADFIGLQEVTFQFL